MRRRVGEGGSGVGRFIEGGLARYPLGGLKDSACPPEFTRHSCGGCGGLILCESVSKKGSESLVFSLGAEGGLACPCKQLAGVRLRRICFGFRAYGVSHPLREYFGFTQLPISSQSQEVQKKCSKTVNFLQFLLKTRSFL